LSIPNNEPIATINANLTLAEAVDICWIAHRRRVNVNSYDVEQPIEYAGHANGDVA
jgi:hypothetical protein